MTKFDKVFIPLLIFCFLGVSGYIISSDNGLKNMVVVNSHIKEKARSVKVTVDGMVKNAGTYDIEVGQRVYDAIAAAGGALNNACLYGLNLDRIITENEHIFVPREEKNSVEVFAEVEDSSYNKSEKCNINTANKEKLMELDGIGDTLAERIISYRNKHGSFKTTDEIQNVKGIGSASYAKIKDYITVEGE